MRQRPTGQGGNATDVAERARRMLSAAVTLVQRGDGMIPEPEAIGVAVLGRLEEEGGQGLCVFDLDDALPGADD